MQIEEQVLHVGLDVGSTTVKVAVLDATDKLIYSEYKRHFANIKETIRDVFDLAFRSVLKGRKAMFNITGSGGLSVAKWLQIPFVQEVIASTRTVETFLPETDVVIELGGEDAKITYFGGSIEQRMNGTCAGGTGAFIDQMATLLKTDAKGLDTLAESSTMIYPIAARCGVFAKTDIQPLINEGAPKEDIAASIFQAVVNQTIAGLACGKPIRGHVAFLGGPLYFLPQLRRRFIETLKLKEGEALIPEHSQLFVAIGAALTSKGGPTVSCDRIHDLSMDISKQLDRELNCLEPLFKDEASYEAFTSRHAVHQVVRASLQEAKGPVYLGIDAGSTTTKAVLMDEQARILYTFYGSNEGSPVWKTHEILTDIYNQLPEGVNIAGACSTGYGEKIVQSAFGIDIGEIETMAHYKAAEHFLPGVQFILDIGGQDMKCIRIEDGVIQDILLNEACSSGCGSFLENFSQSLNMSIQDFAKSAIRSRNPVDLGSRCTVFMNSRVKQAQKEGAEVGDISAGLSYSVIKNALQKVIKIRDYNTMGDKIVVQGGTFYNDAVLRAFEQITGKAAVRPDICGIMGAYGAALIAKERLGASHHTTLISPDRLKEFTFQTRQTRCGKCANNCLLTINLFQNSTFVSGNRCERGAGAEHVISDTIPNIYDFKQRRLFSHYISLKEEDARRGTVGIPRALNMYENYPFWFTFFTKLGYRVRLSARSSKHLFEKGMETIPSESVCYPAKLVHGHIMDLIQKQVPMIFYPCIPYEYQERNDGQNHFSCPIVTSYPEAIRQNVEQIRQNGIRFYDPFLNLDSPSSVKKELFDCLGKAEKISRKEIDEAVDAAYKERAAYRQEVQKQGEKILRYIEEHHMKAIVLCGRPYHVDPEINHGLEKIILEQGMAVLSEDSICHLSHLKRPLRVLDQWTYHARLYDAAEYAGTREDLEVVQLVSFGCGVDAVTADQVQEILKKHNKAYTLIKIDEGSNLGAIRIRLRSLKASMEEREAKGAVRIDPEPYVFSRQVFTKEMKKDYTILAPQMSPIHFRLLKAAFDSFGYHLEVLPSVDHKAIDEGLKAVNNDACYPSILVAGQMMAALKSGKYDLDRTALMITQTGGGCRASNYIGFIRKALQDAGMGQIPVISLNAAGMEKNPGFAPTPGMLNKALMAVVYGDLFMHVLYKVRPYERVEGSANALYEKWNRIAYDNVLNGKRSEMKANIKKIVQEFDRLPIYEDLKKPSVGIVGEILVKYHPTGNNELVRVLEEEGAEVHVPDLMDFLLYCGFNQGFKADHLGKPERNKLLGHELIRFLEWVRKPMKEALEQSRRFSGTTYISEKARLAERFISLGNQTGEGWFLTGEMVEMIEHGVTNIVCVQPFGCLPNHIVAKSMIKPIREAYPCANIAAVDYDPGASEVNQLNRIKLMLQIAHRNAEKAV